MKIVLLAFALFMSQFTPIGAADALSNFTLTDQHAKVRIYEFPKKKVTVMTVADQKGSKQLAAWIEQVQQRYGDRIDIDGIADVSIVPAPFQGMVRDAFKKQLTYSVMLDWKGDVIKQFNPKPSVANLYVITRQGHITKHLAEPLTPAGFKMLAAEIDLAMSSRK